MSKNHVVSDDDVYLAIPLLKGQISCRELMAGEVLIKSLKKDEPIFIDMIDSPYAYNEDLKKNIYQRGIDPLPQRVEKPPKKKNLKKSRKSK